MPADSQSPLFLVVTPSLNCARFIEDTIVSVVTQSGDFRIRYHVQDGGSRDGTVEKLQAWWARLSGDFPVRCQEVKFSYATGVDNGMYDAIGAGFAYVGVNSDAYMTWINADDVILPGAFSFVASAMADFRDVSLIGGRPCEMDEQGSISRIHDLQIYPQSTLASGLHDGRRLPFVMQEGTFWRSALWAQTGGVRRDLRLAGDFDLWRRFASVTQFVSADTALGGHRRHTAQLTADSGAYYRELDGILTGSDLEIRDAEWDQFTEWRRRSPNPRGSSSYWGNILYYGGGHWRQEGRAYPVPLNTSVYLVPSGVLCSSPAIYLSGFSDEEGPYPHVNLPRGFRFLRERVGLLRFNAPAAARYAIRLRIRTFIHGMEAVITQGSRKLLQGAIPATFHDRDCVIAVDTDFRKGDNTIALGTVCSAEAAHGADLLIVSCTAIPQPASPMVGERP